MASTGTAAVGGSRRVLVRSAGLVGAATVAATVLNAIFQIVLARFLEPADYSLLVVLFSVVMIAGVPLSGIQATVAREVSTALAAGDPSSAGSALRSSVRSVLFALPVAAAATALVAVPLATVLNVQRLLPLVWTGCVVGLSALLAVGWGALQGAQRFGVLSAGQFGYMALKLALGLVLVAVGLGVTGALGGLALAAALTAVAVAAALRGLWRSGRGRTHGFRLLSRASAAGALALSAFAALTTLDLLVARVALEPERAGLYAAASVVARALLLVPTILTTVLFPRVAALLDTRRERRHLLAGAATVAIAGLAVTAVVSAVRRPFVELAFGADYAGAAGLLPLLCLAMTFYGVASVYLFHFLAIGEWTYVRVVGALIPLQVVLLLLLHGSGEELVLVQALTAAALVAASELYLRSRPTRVG